MAFTYTRNTHEIRDGNAREVSGSFLNNSGSEGGIINTELHVVRGFSIQLTGSSVVATNPVVNTTFPSDKNVEIVTPANACGIWRAIGE